MHSNSFCKVNHIDRRYSIELEVLGGGLRNDTYIEIGSDGSIDGDDGQEHRLGILHGDRGIDLIENHCKQLARHDYTVNNSCGYHCHVDARDLTWWEICNILSFIYAFDKVIFSLMPKNRRLYNDYCGHLTTSKKELDKAYRYGKTVLKNQSRYQGFNVQAFFKYGSLEFRYHGGTTRFEKIREWIVFCLSITEFMRHKRTRLPKLAATRKNLEVMLSMLKLTEEQKDYFYRRYAKFN
jgi:hypothetical protein